MFVQDPKTVGHITTSMHIVPPYQTYPWSDQDAFSRRVQQWDCSVSRSEFDALSRKVDRLIEALDAESKMKEIVREIADRLGVDLTKLAEGGE